MKQTRDIIFSCTLAMVVLFAIALLVMYFVGVARNANIAVAASCIGLSFLLLVEIAYAQIMVSRERKDADFIAYLKGKEEEAKEKEETLQLLENHKKPAPNKNADMIEEMQKLDNGDLEEIEKKVSELQAKIDALLANKTKTKK
ncbi:MAG: hypothetical protein PHE93_02525 [Clostridia bacterium]|nr:hypothetical protein [Clostridia bacterium]